jgi:hypothetical protein
MPNMSGVVPLCWDYGASPVSRELAALTCRLRSSEHPTHARGIHPPRALRSMWGDPAMQTKARERVTTHSSVPGSGRGDIADAG